MSFKALLCSSVFLAMFPLTGNTAGGLALSDTRLIIEDGRTAAAIVISNTTSTPYLTRAWVENSQGVKTENWMVSPPISLLLPDQSIRLQVTALDPQTLSQDQESVVYLFTHSVPGNDKQDNTLNVAFNSKLKVFYRPKDLPGNMTQAIESLKWTLKNGVLIAKNESNFNISIVTVGLDKNYKQLSGFVLAPRESAEFRVEKKYPKKVTVRWAAMDDYGSPLIISKTISNE